MFLVKTLSSSQENHAVFSLSQLISPVSTSGGGSVPLNYTPIPVMVPYTDYTLHLVSVVIAGRRRIEILDYQQVVGQERDPSVSVLVVVSDLNTVRGQRGAQSSTALDKLLELSGCTWSGRGGGKEGEGWV